MLGNNSSYSIEYLKAVVNKDILSLPASAKAIIKKAIKEHLTVDPIGFGKPLCYSLKGYRHLRVSDYRIAYKVDPTQR